MFHKNVVHYLETQSDLVDHWHVWTEVSSNKTKRKVHLASTILHLYLMTMVSRLMVTRSGWLNCALRDYEAVYWVSIGHYEAVVVGN